MRTVSTVRIFYLLGDKMENYSYRLLVLKCVSLNCLHIEEKGEKIRTAMIMDYLHCGDVIANSFDLKRKKCCDLI